MNETEYKSKLQQALIVRDAFGFSEAEARIFAGLEDELLKEASINQLTVGQVLDQTKDMSGDDIKAVLNSCLTDPELRDQKCGDLFSQDLFTLEGQAKEAEQKPTVDSFLAKLKN